MEEKIIKLTELVTNLGKGVESLNKSVETIQTDIGGMKTQIAGRRTSIDSIELNVDVKIEEFKVSIRSEMDKKLDGAKVGITETVRGEIEEHITKHCMT